MMRENFQKIEHPKPDANEIVMEPSLQGDEKWLKEQVAELGAAQEERRLAQLEEAREKAVQISFSQANYMKDALVMALEPDQLEQFKGFFGTLESLQGQK